MSIKVSFATQDDLQSMLDLDFDIYPVEGLVTTQSVIDRFNKDPYQYLIAKDRNGKLLGYLNIVSVTDSAFKKILDGTWDESEDLIADNIMSLFPDTEINCYITSIITRDNNSDAAGQLLFNLVTYARLLKSKNIRIKNIAAISFSAEGESLCCKLGFESIRKINQLNCGFVPCVYLLDLKKDNSSFLVKKIQKINNK